MVRNLSSVTVHHTWFIVPKWAESKMYNCQIPRGGKRILYPWLCWPTLALSLSSHSSSDTRDLTGVRVRVRVSMGSLDQGAAYFDLLSLLLITAICGRLSCMIALVLHWHHLHHCPNFPKRHKRVKVLGLLNYPQRWLCALWYEMQIASTFWRCDIPHFILKSNLQPL